MELNDYQKTAVLDEHNACLVRANVGSGKTTVLIEKIRYLHQQKKIPLENMIVLTFTNKAAGEIKNRLKIQNIEENPSSLFYGTFHGIALKLLQEVLPLEELGYTKDFQVCLPEEELELANQLIHQHTLRIKYKNRLRKRLDHKYRSATSRQPGYQDDFPKLVTLLTEEKRKQNKMSYEDLLQCATKLLKDHPQQLLQLKWIIIDEVQDCDELQFELIRQLKRPEVGLFAVGDPNQVIYSWRGSMFNIFYKFRELYHAEGEKISVKNHYDPFQEAEYLAEKILALHERGVPLEEVAVFYRLQSQSEILSKVLEKHQIPYEISQKKIIQDIPVLAWFLHILRFLSNHEDLTSGTYVLCDKTFGEGWTSKKARTEILNFTQGSVFLSKSLLFQAMWEYRDTGSGYINLWEQLSLEKYLRPSSSDYKENRRQILSLLKKMESYHSIRDFLNDLVLNGMEPEKDAVSGESVKLMTLHASKGLEFDYVFIIGVNDGLIPLNSRDASTEEEERRLFYVGMTRARKFLELSFYINPGTARVFPGPGRYLSSLPEKYLAHPADATRDTKEAARHLQDLKKMILEEKLRKLETPKQLVEHPKYGRGSIISETEDTIVIQFDDYGEKEMLKAFSQLKKIPNNIPV